MSALCLFGFHDFGPRRVGRALVLSYCRRCAVPMDERNPWPAPSAPTRADEPCHQQIERDRQLPTIQEGVKP